MEKWKKRTIELVSGLILSGKKSPAVIPFAPQKTKISGDEEKFFSRRSCHKLGISPKRLTAMLVALEAERRANLHNLMIIKNGQVICECSHPGYDVNVAHLSHSMSKSLVGILIAMLIEDGALSENDLAISFFDGMSFSDKRMKSLTVKHLLEMKSGVDFAEVGIVTETEWTKAFFNSSMSAAPGETFKYNSLNSYILGRIAERAAGCDITEYLEHRLLAPLGINNYFWEKSPEGYIKGGFGVYMSCESWAKIGMLILGKGEFFGKRIFSEKTAERLCARRSEVTPDKGSFDYGYHIWVGRDDEEYLINGMLGQNVWIYPKAGIVVSLNCGNNELFSESPALNILRSHLKNLPEDKIFTREEQKEYTKTVKGFFRNRHWILPLEKERSILSSLGFKTAYPFDKKWNGILGEYAFSDNGCSILPTFVGFIQNSYSDGINKVDIRRVGEGLFFTFTEGEKIYEFEAGLYDFKTTVLDIRGESYIVKAMASAIEDEDRNPIFKLELIFPELPNTKLIKFSQSLGRMTMRMSETPNEKIAEGFLTNLNSPKAAFVIGMLEKKFGQGFINKKLSTLFNPTLIGISTDRPGYEAIIAAETEIAKENRENSGKLVSSLMSKFIFDDDSKSALTDDGEPKEQNFIMRAINGLLGRDK
jgi:hypothetical protein